MILRYSPAAWWKGFARGAFPAALAIIAFLACVSTAGAVDKASLEDAFAATCSRQLAEMSAAGKRACMGADGFLFYDGELAYAASRDWFKEPLGAGRPLPALLDFAAQLKKLGVELVVLPAPAKAHIYPDKLDASIALDAQGRPPRLDSQLRAMCRQLSDHGVTVVDLADAFLADRFPAKFPGAGPLYFRTDTHWTPAGMIVASQAIAKIVKTRPWFQSAPKLELTEHWLATIPAGDLRVMFGEALVPPETVQVRAVSGFAPAIFDPKSPILIIGDSYSCVWSSHDLGLAKDQPDGFGLTQQLARESGRSIDLFAQMDGGRNGARLGLSRKLHANADFLAGKKMVLYVFTARELVNDDWKLIPLVK